MSRRQLLAAGLTSTGIQERCARRELWRRHPGVYAIGRDDLSPYGEMWAAYLATRGRGPQPHVRALAGWSALGVLGAATLPRRPEIVVRDAELVVRGITIRRTRSLSVDEIVRDANGLPRTSWERAVLDVTARASVADLERVLSRSEQKGVLDLPAIETALLSASGRRGLPKLGRALEPYRGLPAAEYRSLLERLAHKVFVGAGLPGPEINGAVLLGTGRVIHVDLLLRALMIAIEVDGRATHERVDAFAIDRARDRELQKLGYVVLRFTWWEVRRDPTAVVRDVRALVARCA